MSEIQPVGGYTPPMTPRLGDKLLSLPVRIEPDGTFARPALETDLPAHFDDELQRVLSRTSFRLARLRAVRADIEAGTFETKERIQGTVGRLIDELR